LFCRFEKTNPKDILKQNIWRLDWGRLFL